MSDIDLAGLRRIASDAASEAVGKAWVHPPTVLALLDRIEALEAEAKSARDLIAAIADELTPGRRDKDLVIAAREVHRAEARLARVTDDSMAERIARVRALHYPLFNSASALTPRPLCAGDADEDWPCPTIRALEGETNE